MKLPKLHLLVWVGIFLFILFLVSFFIWYGEYDLFRFPFIVEVWGTTSDWVMILVTGATAIAIWKTFQSQLLLQKDQSELTRIEKERRKDEIVPDFGFHRFGQDFIYGVGSNRLALELISDNPAKNISVDFLIYDVLSEGNPKHLFQEKKEYTTYHPTQGPLIFPITNGDFLNVPITSLRLTISIDFSDMDNNRYNIVLALIENVGNFELFQKRGPFPLS